MSDQTIETILTEERCYPPPPEFAAAAVAQPDVYERGFEEFWESEGRERVTWFEPFTQLYKEEGEALVDGYFHATGHGVGLEVHERPGVGRIESEPLLEGDVIALEPGLYRNGYGGVRLEDLVLVTATGAEVLTSFPYQLELGDFEL